MKYGIHADHLKEADPPVAQQPQILFVPNSIVESNREDWNKSTVQQNIDLIDNTPQAGDPSSTGGVDVNFMKQQVEQVKIE